MTGTASSAGGAWVRRCLAFCCLATLLAGCSRGARPAVRRQAAVPRFTEAAERLGIRFLYDHGGSGQYYYVEMAGGGGALFDYDNDGWLDVYLAQGAPLPGCDRPGPFRNRLYRSLQGRAFEEVTDRAGVSGERGGKKLYCIGCAVGDYDSDGRVDLFVTGFRGSILYRNCGDGRFTDATRSAGIADTRFATSAAFFDYDRDGRLDLAVCEYLAYRLGDPFRCVSPRGETDYCRPDAYPSAQPRLYRNLGGGRFRDVTDSAGLTRRSSKALGVVAGDVDGDGDPDLYFACDLTPNLLYVNHGNGKFREEAVTRGCALSTAGQALSGMGVDMRDADGDRLPDLLVTNYWMEPNNLYRNLGGGAFADVGGVAGIAGPNTRQVVFGAALRDFNNDGRLDIYMTNGHVLAHPEDSTPGAARAQTDQLFLNAGNGQFREVSREAGDWFSRPHVGRGAAFGDVDNDGDLDVLLVPNEGPAALLINEGAPGGRLGSWLQVRLEGRRSNRDGIGARIDVTAGGRTHSDEVRSAYSYCSASDLRAHFGLGSAARVDRLEVRWPGGQVDAFSNLAANCLYTVAEGVGIR